MYIYIYIYTYTHIYIYMQMLMQCHKIPMGTKVLGNIKLPPPLNFYIN